MAHVKSASKAQQAKSKAAAPQSAPRQQLSPPSSKPSTPMSPSNRDPQTNPPRTQRSPRTTFKLPPKRPRTPSSADNDLTPKRRRATSVGPTRLPRSPKTRRRHSDGPDLLTSKVKKRRRLSGPPPRTLKMPQVCSREVKFLSTPLPEPSSLDEEEEYSELMQEDFTPHEAVLFQRIRKRGAEPLMPAHWQVDFPTIPDSLFAARGEMANIEEAHEKGFFHAVAAFRALVGLGAMVRARMAAERPVEGMVFRGLRKYVEWSVRDAKVAGYEISPQLAISWSSPRGAENCEKRMDKRMRSIAASLHAEESRLKALKHPVLAEVSGTVYGLAVSGCIVALLTLNARAEDAKWRTLLVVDFSDKTLDFWNAIGIALLVIAAREDEIERVEFYRKRKVERPPTTLWKKEEGEDVDA